MTPFHILVDRTRIIAMYCRNILKMITNSDKNVEKNIGFISEPNLPPENPKPTSEVIFIPVVVYRPQPKQQKRKECFQFATL